MPGSGGSSIPGQKFRGRKSARNRAGRQETGLGRATRRQGGPLPDHRESRSQTRPSRVGRRARAGLPPPPPRGRGQTDSESGDTSCSSAAAATAAAAAAATAAAAAAAATACAAAAASAVLSRRQGEPGDEWYRTGPECVEGSAGPGKLWRRGATVSRGTGPTANRSAMGGSVPRRMTRWAHFV
jgi:hypothetical protein